MVILDDVLPLLYNWFYTSILEVLSNFSVGWVGSLALGRRCGIKPVGNGVVVLCRLSL